jgi:hypothetical protein
MASSTSRPSASSAVIASSTSSSSVATRWALYEGRASVRNAGRQSSSTHIATSFGRWSTSRRASMFKKPYTPRAGSESGSEW